MVAKGGRACQPGASTAWGRMPSIRAGTRTTGANASPPSRRRHATSQAARRRFADRIDPTFTRGSIGQTGRPDRLLEVPAHAEPHGARRLVGRGAAEVGV